MVSRLSTRKPSKKSVSARRAQLWRATHGLALLTLSACGAAAQFPLEEPLWADSDARPFSEKPEEYFSPFAWDGANQMVFRPISRFFAVDPAGEAVNVNSLDEVPDSTWFQNRIGTFSMTPKQVARGACDTPPLDPSQRWLVTGAKPNGANPGFIIKGPDDRRYLIKFDGVLQGPRATAADVLGSRLYHAAGYFAPCNRIVYLHPSILEVEEGATVEDSTGEKHALEQSHIEEVFSKGLQLEDGRYRASSSLFLEGEPLGPFKYQGLRDDDPNDVIPHEDRRELRGMRVLASWINHFDSREQNSLDMWIETQEGRGYIRHNMLDFGDSLGSLWQPPALGRRIGHAYYLDFPYLFEDWLTLGIIERPWDRTQFGKSGVVFAYFNVKDFDPEMWRTGYPNPAFIRMRERDAAWMARIIAQFRTEHVLALIETADLRDSLLSRELLRILKGRRDKILDRYLGKLAPLTKPTAKAGRLCMVDLLVQSRQVELSHRGYSMRAFLGEELVAQELTARKRPEAKICGTLPEVPGASSQSPRYLIVDFIARTVGSQAQPPARVHLYHLGADDYRVVGLERPDDAEPPG